MMRVARPVTNRRSTRGDDRAGSSGGTLLSKPCRWRAVAVLTLLALVGDQYASNPARLPRRLACSIRAGNRPWEPAGAGRCRYPMPLWSVDGQDDVRRLDQGAGAITHLEVEADGALLRDDRGNRLAMAEVEDDFAVDGTVLAARHRTG
jgi:hypothetical protein